ncbi:MAG: nudix-type nucleoside diphosphatase (YffH/AdpP family) [Halocynthiibacter sp.]
MIYGDIFLCGLMEDAAMQAAVLGIDAAGEAASLAGFDVVCAAESPFGQLVEHSERRAHGVILRGLSENARQRLEFAARVFEAQAQAIVTSDQNLIHFSAPLLQQTPFERVTLQGEAPKIAVQAIRELMRYFGSKVFSESDLRRRYPLMKARAASALRAQSARPNSFSTPRSRSDITVIDQRLPYSNFFAVEEDDLRFKTYSGTQSAVITRAGFMQCDAVTVLPYDPVRDCVLLVEQFRFGPYIRGDANPWSLEPIAGRVDPDEGPEAAAHREAIEEAHLTLKSLHKIAQYYPSPGAVSEYLYSYVALADLPDDIEGVAGLDIEDEDIRSIRVPFGALMAAIETGEINNGPLILSAQWLAANRTHLQSLQTSPERAD